MKLIRMMEIMKECEVDAERKKRKMSCGECPLGKEIVMAFEVSDSDWLNGLTMKISPCLLMANLAMQVKDKPELPRARPRAAANA